MAHHRLAYIKYLDENGAEMKIPKRRKKDAPEPSSYAAVCECGEVMAAFETKRETISVLGAHINERVWSNDN